MSNILTQNPFVIDTPGAGVLTSMQLFVRAIKWDAGPSAVADDEAKVTDLNGNVFFDSHVAAKDAVDFESFSTQGKTGRYINGLIVPTLSHGKVYIYLD